nr:SEC14 domain and spectrin repeat-containing protein 1-B-like [Parasteatoda tepidariorum]
MANKIQNSQANEGEPYTGKKKSYLEQLLSFVEFKESNLAGAVLSQGLQLIETLRKVRLSEKKRLSHHQHIGGWLAFVEVEKEFRLKELENLTFKVHARWQMQRCEFGIKEAMRWLRDLSKAMLAQSNEIGESADEADALFLQHIKFKQVAEESFNIGTKFLMLQRGLKNDLNYGDGQLHSELINTWDEFLKIFKGCAERLNLCQNFYRNITKNLKNLEDLKKTIHSGLSIFGEIRQQIVMKRHRRSWFRVMVSMQQSIETGKRLLHLMQKPLISYHE